MAQLLRMQDTDEGDPAVVEKLQRRADRLRRQMGDAMALASPQREAPADPERCPGDHPHGRRGGDPVSAAARSEDQAQPDGVPLPSVLTLISPERLAAMSERDGTTIEGAGAAARPGERRPRRAVSRVRRGLTRTRGSRR